MKRVAILQSNYLPWKGYFDLIASVDEFVLFDCVKYTKRDWRNRNKIKTPNSKIWLSVPVEHGAHNKAIDETKIAHISALKKHWKSIQQAYARAPGFGILESLYKPILLSDTHTHLSALNRELIDVTCHFLGIRTRITDSRDYPIAEDRNDRLVDICTIANADEYLSGPAAKNYLVESAFAAKSIRVSWMSYEGYPEYPQINGDFDHYVSIVDLIANTAENATDFMLRAGKA